jgi:hypothetical protein
LRVNNRLTDPIVVTSGTPEGSINSPEIFSIVYKVILDKLGIEELPSDMSKIDPKKVYYVIYADDLTFLSMDLSALGRTAEAFEDECVEFDLAMNRPKSKWMAFLPPNPTAGVFECEELSVSVHGEMLENVDTFTYLGYDLDCDLDDKAHTAKLNKRLLQAARATGQLLRDMKCGDLKSLKKYWVTLVMSQLYGSIFVDESDLEVDKAVGTFVKSALNLPHSFPHVVCEVLLGVRSARRVVLEQRMRFLLKVEGRLDSPVFSALLVDRGVLFRMGVGLNAMLASTLTYLDVLPTADYRVLFQNLIRALEQRDLADRSTRLLSACGRAFWTELLSDGMLPNALCSALCTLHYEQSRIVFLFLVDALRWTAFTSIQKCAACDEQFTSSHFFLCDRPFLSGQEWSIFLALCHNESWDEAIEHIFAVLKRWATGTSLFKPLFVLHVLEFVPSSD